MERLFIIIFLLSVLPYIGIPSQYDMPLIAILFVALLYSVYLIGKKHSRLQSETKKTTQEKTEEKQVLADDQSHMGEVEQD